MNKDNLKDKLKRLNEINIELSDYAEEIKVEGVKKLMQYDIAKIITVLMNFLAIEGKEDE